MYQMHLSILFLKTIPKTKNNILTLLWKHSEELGDLSYNTRLIKGGAGIGPGDSQTPVTLPVTQDTSLEQNIPLLHQNR